MAGKRGTWRCAEGGATPLAAPLPEPPPATEPGPAIMPLPDLANDPTLGVSTVDALLPAPAPAPVTQTMPDIYTLKIASVSAPDEIPDFVESYGLDPSLVRFMPITEGDNTRQLILWGRFVSRAQAARAVVAMPAAVQAIRPQIAEVAGLAGPIRNYAQLNEPVAAQPPARPEPRQPEALAVTPATPAPATDSSPTAAEPLVLATNEPAPEAREATAEPAPSVEPEPPAETADAIAEPVEDELVSMESAIQDPPPRILQPAPASEPEPEPEQEQEPESEPEASPDRSPEPVAPQAAAAAPANEGPTPATRQLTPPPPQQPPPGRPVVRARVQTATAFLTLPGDGYCIQLTSLSSRRLLTPYLRRHGVDPREVYALDLDEGAGVRTLLLTGSFASLAQAEAARDQLPSSVRSPWVRTIGALQNKLREAR